ncbi:heavy-metal-associated domain-containing protein [Flavihumibacter profundi]|jgi:periplasmic mercuric ion binding protein|uniref:heavy-metal-associated domain-containing protein n=1 Tax=Flavihumibacter profundi TaxID=2716883 RepID=UPI001CC6B478|nr:cation transporter [Flavihumibacter profundi]MBZ5855806.1 cation transporter [Flavihumibacter profundi]
MKSIALLLTLIIGFGTVSMAQTKKELQKVTINTPTVQCETCKKKIEDFLSKEDGVETVVVDYKRKQTKVTFHSDRTNIENIKTAIANVGYDADDIAANEESYQKLPKCCKKPEDGGGMKKN